MKRKNTLYSKIFYVVFLAAIAILVFNILFLAGTGKHLISQADIATYAKENRSETTKTITANRGNIYTYDGELVATDRVAYNVIVYLNSDRPGYGDEIAYVDKPELTAKIFSKYITSWTEEEIRNKLTEEGLWWYTFKAYLSSVDVEALKADIEANELHGIEFGKTASRSYQYRHFSSYIIGLVNLNDDDPDHVIREGAFGLEAAFDEELNGINGTSVYQADIEGHAIYNAKLTETPAVDGADIYLTLDSEIQNMLEVLLDDATASLGARKMWCAVMDADTGRIMAVASNPDFDLQDRSTIDSYQDLFLTYTYEVGSVMKPFIYLTAIDTGVYNGNETYMSGRYTVPGVGVSVQDHNSGVGWGEITYDIGLLHSSNTAIAHLIMEKLRWDDVESYMEKIGFFQNYYAYDVDGLPATSGWAAYKDTDSDLDRVTLGFGQASTISPYELLRSYTVFANDGAIVSPYLIEKIINSSGDVTYSATTEKTERIYTSEAISHVRELLSGVVNNTEHGTGNNYIIDGLEVFGKTGTGQIWDSNLGSYHPNIYAHSFVGGAPADDPEVLITIGCESDYYAPNSKVMGEVVRQLLPKALSLLNIETTTSEDSKYTDFTIGSYLNTSVPFATKRLSAEGLTAVVIGDGNVVKGQYPESNTTISTATQVFLLTDASTYTLPDFSGWSRKDVAAYLQLLNVPVTFTGSGTVISQNVESGTDISTITSLIINLETSATNEPETSGDKPLET